MQDVAHVVVVSEVSSNNWSKNFLTSDAGRSLIQGFVGGVMRPLSIIHKLACSLALLFFEDSLGL